MLYEERMLAAIAALPVLPRTLYRLHNLNNVDTITMAKALGADDADIRVCLAEARSMIHGYYPDTPKPRFDPDGAGLPIARLERRLQGAYQSWLEERLAGCGYASAVAWPEPTGNIAADESAAATFIVSLLAAPLRATVARWSSDGVATVDLWRRPWRLRRIARERLLDVANELHCAGWETFEFWLADRIAPDLHYPDGIMMPRRLRALLPEEMTPPLDRCFLPRWCDTDRQARYETLPYLTQAAYALFHLYGRNSHEITKRLGIGRRSLTRRLRQALYVVEGWPIPSVLWVISFHLRMDWSFRLDRWRRAWAALHE